MTWQRVRAEFDALVVLPPPAREQRLQHLATTDRWLADQLKSLLEHDSEASRFLERDPAAGPAAARPTTPAAVAPGLRVGRYELVRPLGTGGMGSVWEARQQEPVRRVAIKLVPRAAGSDAERWRFRHEVRVLASLAHPAIATFFEAGSDDLGGTEVAWFTMELVAGACDVLTWADRQGLDRAARLALFERLCDAVDYGHRRGVLHRDLKPGNVLVDGEGRVKLIDFGIARALTDDADGEGAGRTATDHLVGTLQYMAPEQLRGDRDAIGTWSDVYALGVILYLLLCGRPPFDLQRLSLAQMAATVLEREPVPPRLADPTLPRELSWILLRALAKDPAQRYPTVASLVDDLDHFRKNLPLAAGPPSAWYRVRKFARRNRVALAFAGMLALGVGAGAYGLWRGAAEARAGEAIAREGERKARRGFALSSEISRLFVRTFNAVRDTSASRDLKVHELLDRTPFAGDEATDPLVEAFVRGVRGEVYLRVQRFAEAKAELERALARHALALPDESFGPGFELRMRAKLGRALACLDDAERGEAMVRAACDEARAAGPDKARLQTEQELCHLLFDRSVFAELQQHAATVVALARRLGDLAAETEAELWRVAAANALGRHGDALATAESLWQRLSAAPAADPTDVAASLFAWVSTLQHAGRLDEAEALYPRLLEATRRARGDDHADVLVVRTNQCELWMRRGKLEPAVAAMREILQRYQALGHPVDANHLIAVQNLGQALNQSGRFAEAEPFLARAAELSRSPRLLDPRDPTGPAIRFNYGACLAWQRRWQEAEPILVGEYEAMAKLLPPGHESLAKLRRTLVAACERNGHAEQAAAWRDR